MKSDSDSDTGTKTETTAEVEETAKEASNKSSNQAKREDLQAEQAQKAVSSETGEDTLDNPITEEPASASAAEGPSLRDFDWFMSFILAHKDEDIPNVEYILRGDELNGNWKCLISEGSDDENADISAFFDCPGILCTMEIDMTDNKGTVTGYPYLLVENAENQTKDERDPFSYQCSFENMVLSADSDEGESFYVMFYRDGSTVRGYGSYYLSDNTEMGIMLTR
ncbi:MAG: hypothetical protein K5770_10110 [Lachnospiraceae bacterium]|nr:hypothetical protein [Lachnospiraceae bacterium]